MEPDDAYPNDDEQEGMRPMMKALRLNAIIVLIYAGCILVFSFVAARGEMMEYFLVWTGLLMLGHGVVCLIAGIYFFIAKKPEWGKGTLLSGLVILIIGFSSCVAVLSTLSFH